MTAITLTIAERKAHRADAHHLNPLVLIGADGLSDGVKKEIDFALSVHGLIKVRVFGDDRAAREAMYNELCDALGAAPIQHIGKLLVLWRPPVDRDAAKAAAEAGERRPGPKDVKVLKYSSRGGQRPEVKIMRVLGNQRLTKAGVLKNAKPFQKSVKKRAQG